MDECKLVGHLPDELLLPMQAWLTENDTSKIIDRVPIPGAPFWMLGSEHRVNFSSVPQLLAIREWLVSNLKREDEFVVDFAMGKVNGLVPRHIDDRLKHRISRRFIVHLLNSEGSIHHVGDTTLVCKRAGEILRFNNNYFHETISGSDATRYSALIDFAELRLKQKFENRFDDTVYQNLTYKDK